MVPSLIELQLLLRLEQENLAQNGFFFLVFFLPFEHLADKCYALDRNKQAIIPQNAGFRVNYKLSLHHQYYVTEGTDNTIFACINKTI